MPDRLRNFPAITWENIALSEAADRRREHRAHLSNVTPQLAQTVADYSFAYPKMSGGIATGLALAGIQPLSPEAEVVSDRESDLLAAGLNPPPAKQGFWDVGLGRAVKGFTREAFTLFESLYDEVTKGITSAFYSAGRSIFAGEFNSGSAQEALRGSFGMSPSALGYALEKQGYKVNKGEGFLLGGTLAPETELALSRGVPFIEAIKNPAQMELGIPLRQYSDYVRNKNAHVIAGSENVADARTGVKGLQVTPGRFVASIFTEPGTKPFDHFSGLADFASNIFLDPANVVPFKWAEDVRGLNKTLLANPARKTILARGVDDWLSSSHGDRVAQYFADTNDYLTLHGLFRKNAVKSNVDANFISSIARTTDKDGVKDLLRRAARGGQSETGMLTELPVKQSLVGRATGTSGLAGIMARAAGHSGGAVDVGGLRHAITRNRETTSWLARMGAEVGSTALRVDDISGSVDDFGQWMQAAGMNREQISQYMGRMAQLQNGGIENATVMWGIVSDAYRELGKDMVAEGLSKHVANAFTQAFNSMEDYRKFWIDNTGQPQMFAGSKYEVMINGQLMALPSAQLFSEMMDWMIPLLDMRKVRKGLRRAAWAKAGFEDLAGKRIAAEVPPGKALPRFRLEDMTEWEDLGPSVAGALVNAAVQKVWKPMVLLRVAWPVRVIAEEQVRMMAAGLDGVWNHPVHAIINSFGEKLGVTRLASDVKGTPFEDALAFRNAMSKRGMEFGLGRQRSLYTNEWIRASQGSPEYWDGLAIELQQLADDPIVQRIANDLINSPEVDEVDILKAIKDDFWDESTEMGKLRGILAADSSNWDLVNIREAADAVIDDRFARLLHKTGGDYVHADHVRGEWFDSFGNKLELDPETGLYVSQHGMAYELPDPPRDSRGLRVKQSSDPAVQQGTVNDYNEAVAGAVRWADQIQTFRVPGDQVFTGTESVGEMIDSILLLRSRMQGIVGYEDLYQRYTDLDRLLDNVRGLRMELARNDPQAIAQIRPDVLALRPMAEEGGHFINVGIDVAGTPSGRAQLNAMDLIEIAGDEALVRARFDGYRPRPGQPSLDELATKSGWTRDELTSMLDTSAMVDPHEVKQVHPDIISAHGVDDDGVTMWTEYYGGVPGQPTKEVVKVAHDGWMTGELHIRRDLDGRIIDVDLLRVAQGDERAVFSLTEKLGEGAFMPGSDARLFSTDDLHRVDLPGSSKRDAARLIEYATKDLDADAASALLDFAFGGVPVRDWLTSAGLNEFVDGDTPLLSLGELVEVLRAQHGAAWAGRAEGPLGSLPTIALSNDGARSLANSLKRLGETPRGRVIENSALYAKAWPQQHMLAQRVRAPDQTLLQAVADGKLGKHTISFRDVLDDAEKVARISEISRALQGGWGDALDILPQFTKTAAKADTKKLDGVVDHMFDLLMSRPTNKLSRAPAFKQFYWKRVSEMLPHMDEATRAKVLANAKKAGVGTGDLRSMVKAAIKGDDVTETALKSMADELVAKLEAGVGDLTSIDDVDEIAKAFALQETKRLLYDLTKKTQFFDITRNIFPFGEAWYEIITTWMRLFSENPHLVRRLQQGLEGARQEGIFYSDPATGEEIFAMPHLDFLANMMNIGGEQQDPEASHLVKPQFSGRVEGVNLMLNNYLPGLGPLVQMPLASFARDIMDDPNMRWARDLVFPYGYPDTQDPGAIINSVMPAWFRKALTSFGRPTGDDQRLFNNTVIDVLRAMQLNGEIPGELTPSETAKVLEEARNRAKDVYKLRFIQQFIGPTGAQVRWDVELDPKGEAFAYQVLATEYREMIEANQGDRVQAFYDFVNQYGFDPAGLATAKTESLRPRSVTEEGLAFQQSNSELFRDFSLTAYYAAPDAPDGEFNYNAYLAQLRDADRVGLTPEQWWIERNRLLGSISYEKLRRKAVEAGVRNEPQVAAYLRTMRYFYMEKYPGYGFDNIGVVAQPEQRQFMMEFETWRDDPRLSRTQAGQGLTLYLRSRDKALALAEAEMGVSADGFANAKSTAQLREYLLQIGQALTRRYPDFGVIFQRHYLWEVEAPEPVAPTELLGVDFGVGT